jgi:hypothetical protein
VFAVGYQLQLNKTVFNLNITTLLPQSSGRGISFLVPFYQHMFVRDPSQYRLVEEKVRKKGHIA